jgi:hypothetical protein
VSEQTAGAQMAAAVRRVASREKCTTTSSPVREVAVTRHDM